MCVTKPCSRWDKFQKLRGGIDAYLFTDKKYVYRGVDKKHKISEIKEITKDLVGKTILEYEILACDQFIYYKTRYIKSTIDKKDLEFWKKLITKLHQFHTLTKSTNLSEKRKKELIWNESIELIKNNSTLSFCHTDLHEKNALLLDNEIFLIDIYEIRYGLTALDLAITAAYCAIETDDMENYIKIINAYPDKRVIKESKAIDTAKPFEIIIGYGPPLYSKKVKKFYTKNATSSSAKKSKKH